MVFVCRNMLSMVCVCVYCFFWDLILCIWENGIENFVFSKASDEEMKEAVEVDKKWSQKIESSKKSSIQNVTDLIEQVHMLFVEILTQFAFFSSSLLHVNDTIYWFLS